MSDEEQQPPPPTSEQPVTTMAPPSGDIFDGMVPADAPQQVLPLRQDKPDAIGVELALVVAAGFFGNLALRRGATASVAALLVVVLLAGALVATRRVSRREPLVLLGLAMALAPWLVVRSATALTAFTTITIVVLLAVAVGFSTKGTIFHSSVRAVGAHVLAPMFEWMYGLAMVQRFAKRTTERHSLMPLLRGLLIAVPVLVVFTSLLASADDVFARVLLIGDLPTLVGHLVVTAIIAVGLFGFVSRAAHETPPPGSQTDIRFLGPVEVLMILGSLVVLFAAFVVTQIVVAAGGASHVLETEGLTQADHARRGFFQLLWVAGLATGLVGGLRALRIVDPERGKDRFSPLAFGTLALTLVIAVISMQRLLLYIGWFGLTQLRLWSLAGAGLIAVLIVLFAVSVVGWRSDRSWFPGAALIVGALFVFGMNIANPDNLIASYNLGNPTADGLDVYTLSLLSDDAVETLVDGLPDIAPVPQVELQGRLCERVDRRTEYGVFEYNRSKVGADDTLDRFCGEDNRVQPRGYRDD